MTDQLTALDCRIRPAREGDTGILLTLIRELAEYEKLAHEVMADEAALRANLFGPHAYAEALIAEIDGAVAGFALFFHNFSTFLGKPGIYIEDVYVRAAYRGGGIGGRFFREVARLALDRDCGRIQWSVLDWNESAIKFYEKLGAAPVEGWMVMRVAGDGIRQMAEG